MKRFILIILAMIIFILTIGHTSIIKEYIIGGIDYLIEENDKAIDNIVNSLIE